MADTDGDGNGVFYLHGDLDLKIIEARRLPNMDLVSERFRRCITACDTIKFHSSDTEPSASTDRSGRRTHHRRKIITSDPYVTVSVPQSTVARTRVLKNAQNPRWDERFNIPLAHPVDDLEFRVKDDDIFGAQTIGTVKIPAQDIAAGKMISGWFPVIGPSGKPPKPETALHIEMLFTSVNDNPLYRLGIAADPEHRGVRHTYFPLRKGSSVRLYQDAHCHDETVPEIQLDGGKVYRQEKCWEDICYAISEAHHMVYLVGWSIYHKVKLVREPTKPLPRGGDLTLGELLKYKSEEGVRVLLLVWDDKTSHDKFFFKTAGVMQTHDEETRKFFKHSSVMCVLAPRYASSKLSFLKQQVVGNVFTHHQKCVIVDTQAAGNDRKITAFIGGLDLCDGRYDTPKHRLFHDLDTVFSGDFHNPTFPSGTRAPRQPWHDLHCRIDGPAAYDVLLNFEQRWRKATRWKEFTILFKKSSQWHDDSLLKIERISWILSPSHPTSKAKNTNVPGDDPLVWVSNEDDPENWHVQIFRSIDSGSLKGFPKNVDVALSKNLICSKNLVIDKSIQTGYIQAIRSAQHFIYIENQYFIGSSYAWPSYKDAGADNLIPMELALKIANKIRAKERFAVYVVLPMWPEGDPKSGAMQEILFWQGQTMQMMYDVVARELKSMQITDVHPQDYLNFYCLGNREDFDEETSSSNGAQVSGAYKYRRFMIYVHAKGMIVDDEYVIIGSANINQRSMAGTKDTEIAMGAYQPHHTWSAKKRHPRGQIYGYRMSLWREHLGMLDETFEEPGRLECVRKVNAIADNNWRLYTSEDFSLLQGHILKYPIQVDSDGKVSSLPECENFPDAGGKILGSQSTAIPDILTT
ncbi:phospholipase D delta isoform X1 [Gastrolobium bilobum]|uniref:phospholipase D delta isoform X1 n=1 Tax=Gastrolobium bilobum TaxID=150636 RepID=UPI002AB14C6B|nr:phospholipase D delta isoform X1 [Gastrolobium bilobum]